MITFKLKAYTSPWNNKRVYSVDVFKDYKRVLEPDVFPFKTDTLGQAFTLMKSLSVSSRRVPVKHEHEPSEYRSIPIERFHNMKFASGRDISICADRACDNVNHKHSWQRYVAQQLAVAAGPGVMSVHEDFKSAYEDYFDPLNAVQFHLGGGLDTFEFALVLMAGLVLVGFMFLGLGFVQHVIDVHPY